jgi:glycosyltransferase involved in cell wall biosynthesis
MLVSIEVPAFKGGWLIPCIESVLRQTSPHWRLSLVWDGGDDLSKKILERVERLKDPRIQVFFEARRGIARARRFLTERSSGDWILPLDDDDVLTPDAVESFLAEAAARPWSALIRARRDFIDESGRTVDMPQWFPFEPRHYEHGMTTDVFNHCQPYLIRRSAYEKTSGWEGFGDFMFAGEDCDIFLKLEETGPIELLEKTLYRYRINRQRTSDVLGRTKRLRVWVCRWNGSMRCSRSATGGRGGRRWDPRATKWIMSSPFMRRMKRNCLMASGDTAHSAGSCSRA